eukprot:TRINITY_DN7611_c0_g1_i1.p1 TRINITY_DN7611_c0_g1~~TRINITY_DN7611_c0_g1_i1.p1  ORF type:complete len:457 (-),score=117.69 TRINITY_DN7611_c0_g1_i1:199-1569(-)
MTAVVPLLLLSIFMSATGASRVVSPSWLRGSEFESVLFGSSPVGSFDNISIVWYHPSSRGAECHSDTFEVSASASDGPQAVIIIPYTERYCFKEKIAQAAKAKGFAAVIWRSMWTPPGWAAFSSWGSNTAPIPMFEVLSSVLQPEMSYTLNLYPTPSKFSGISWMGPQIPLLFILAILSLLKAGLCSRALATHFISSSRPIHELSVGQSVLMIEVASSLFSLLCVVDFMGQLHILPIPVWFNVIQGSFLLTNTNTFLLAKAMLAAEATIRHQNFEWKRKCFLNFVLALLISSNGVLDVLISWELFYTSAAMSVVSGSVVICQGVLAAYFLMSRKKIMNLLHNTSHRDNVSNSTEQVRNLNRMSLYMYIAGFFLLANVVTQFMPAVGALVGSTAVTIFATLVALIFNSLAGLSQVLSLPEKVTKIKIHVTTRTAENNAAAAATNPNPQVMVVQVKPT